MIMDLEVERSFWVIQAGPMESEGRYKWEVGGSE